MTCKELVELVTDYLEGALAAEDQRRFEEHLARCEGCVNYVQQMKTTLMLLGGLHEDRIAPQVQNALLEAFRDWKQSSVG